MPVAPALLRAPSVTDVAQLAWYALVDTARDPALYPLVGQCRERECLVLGDTPEVLAATLPNLVRLHDDEPLLDHWRDAGPGRGWGILLQSELSIGELRLHLKKVLNVRLPDGATVWFRFYDPLVLRTLLLASGPDDLAPWFRHVRAFVVESEGGDVLYHLSCPDGQLVERVERVLP